MKLIRWFFLFTTLLLIGLSGNGYSAGQSHAVTGVSSTSLIGTWHSAKGTLTFKADGTVNYKGKRYYYAVSSGGILQLSRKRGDLTIPYQLAGGKLTLTVDGKATVYTSRR